MGNLTTAREGQITERFTKAVEQLGSEYLQIRLGGIYALDRIAKESEKEYWPIMEILTAYVRIDSQYEYCKENVEIFKSQMNLPVNIHELLINDEDMQIKPDIKAILDIIKNRKYSFPSTIEPDGLDLHRANLKNADLTEANLEYSRLDGTFFGRAFLNEAHLNNAFMVGTLLIYAKLGKADLTGANLTGADLTGADLTGANLTRAKNLTIDQLLNAKTLSKVELDEQLRTLLEKDHPDILE